MSLNYNIIETIKLLNLCIKNNMFISIVISVILLEALFFINKDKLILKYVILVLNISLVILILLYYLKDILTFNFSNPINNIYFYFLNSIIFLIILTILLFKTNYIKINYIFYGLSLIGITYSLFITHYFNNTTLIIIGNIFPIIKFGNMLYIAYYLFLIIKLCNSFLTKKI